jgi:4-diphosphocytidyl-2-C-methyl-D-erythritol kinase
MSLTLPAPAKLNLFLHIVGKRPDGYHNLQTVFQFLNVGDTLRFEPRQDAQIQLHSDLNFPSEKNLVWQAAKALQQYTHTSFGVDIHLAKQLPMGAGLGGGSSDAATTLVALNHLWKTELSTDTLATLGQTLGADVPVFVRGQASWAEGIGERLTAMDYPEDWYVVLIPPVTVITAEIFAHAQLTRDTPYIKMTDFLANPESVRNDFESLVRDIYPAVGEALDWLGEQSEKKARLTGSGSAVFVRLTNQIAAEQVLRQKPTFFEGFVAKSMNRSPLFFELDKMHI